MSRQQKVVVRTTSVPRGWAPGVEPRSVHGGYQAMNPKAWRAALLTTPRNVAGNPDSPQAVVFLTSIIDVTMGS